MPGLMPAPAALRRVGRAAYRDALLALLPLGRAWRAEPESVQGRVCDALAAEPAHHHGRATDLLEESCPDRIVELLADWERACGLPDPCTPQGDATAEERRAAVVARLTATGGQTIAYFRALAERLGYAVAIREVRPFEAGWSDCGGTAECGPPEIRHVWHVAVAGPRVTHFRAGESEAGGDPLVTVRVAEDLECLLRRWKPAQSLLAVDYEGA